MSGRVGKYTDELAAKLLINNKGKIGYKNWDTDAWRADQRVLLEEVHFISKALIQRLEHTYIWN